jgi:alpha-glucan,water dikinase
VCHYTSAVLTTCSVDVLSHSAVRARNGGVLFATCYDEEILKSLANAAGSAVSITVKGDDVVWEEIDASTLTGSGGEGRVALTPGRQISYMHTTGRHQLIRVLTAT